MNVPDLSCGKLFFVIQVASRSRSIPNHTLLKKWVAFIFKSEKRDVHICLRIVGKKEIQYLNARYRHQPKPTNVLSFCYTSLKDHACIPLANGMVGDLVICAPIVHEEAIFHHIPVLKHWAHIVVHGCLHLMGYDHTNVRKAERMEKKEICILKAFGFS